MNHRCFECGRPAYEAHHVVPRSLVGTRTVPLCIECHAKADGRSLGRRRDHHGLVVAGIARARAQGKQIGAPALPLELVIARVDKSKGLTLRAAAKLFGVSHQTIARWRGIRGWKKVLPLFDIEHTG